MAYRPEVWQQNRPKMRRRRCKLDSCKQLYVPKAHNQEFCSQAHRKEYALSHHGEQFKDAVRELCREEIRRLVKRLALK